MKTLAGDLKLLLAELAAVHVMSRAVQSTCVVIRPCISTVRHTVGMYPRI